MLDINNDEKTLSPLASFHPEMAYCHSERSEESPANQGNKRFFVAFAPQNDTRELGFRMETSYYESKRSGSKKGFGQQQLNLWSLVNLGRKTRLVLGSLWDVSIILCKDGRFP